MAEADETLLWQWGACADVSVFVLLNLKIILVYTGHSTIIDGTVLLNLADRKDPGFLDHHAPVHRAVRRSRSHALLPGGLSGLKMAHDLAHLVLGLV